jgi:transcriptional repressor NrdR
MRCPECSAQDTRVIESRDTGDAVRRRRECLECNARFTTHERFERRQLWVLKRDGRKEPFSREKVLAGLSHACRKRPFSAEQLDQLADRVVSRLEEQKEPVLPASVVGEAVMQVLREVDEVAYVRFASVYQAFESVDQFVSAVAPLRAAVDASPPDGGPEAAGVQPGAPEEGSPA